MILDVPSNDIDCALDWLIATSPPAYFGCAGGGGYLLHLLTGRRGGASRFLSGSRLCYDAADTEHFLGERIDGYCTPRAALALARASLQRVNTTPRASTLGIGITASFLSNRERRGEERCHVAIASKTSHTIITKKFNRTYPWTREAQDQCVALLCIQELCRFLGMTDVPNWVTDTQVEQPEREGVQSELIEVDGRTSKAASGTLDPERTLIYSGSFNPLHEGHRAVAAIAAARSNRRVVFELPLSNAESGKAIANLKDARRRARQFAWYAPVLLAFDMARFIEKLESYGTGIAFAVGADTAARLYDERFYGSTSERDAAFSEFVRRQVTFYVASRRNARGILTHGLERVPAEFGPHFVELTLDIPKSSTEIRDQRGNTEIRDQRGNTEIRDQRGNAEIREQRGNQRVASNSRTTVSSV